MKIIKSLCICFFSFAAFTQTNLLFHSVDTLRADFRSGGQSIDSLDLYYAEKQTTLPGGMQNNPFGKNGSDYFNFFQSLAKQYRTLEIAAPKFTALPHLGFMYGIGSGGQQYLHTDYQQTFRANIHLNMHYNRQVSASLYKQSDFTSDAFTFSLARYGKNWKHLLEGASTNFVRALNGGVSANDAKLLSYGLEFATINKEQAKDSSKRYFLQHQSVWNFIPVDSLRKIETGILFSNQLRVDRRIYRETDTIAKLYTLFGNPTFTRDLAQWSNLETGISYFLKTKRHVSAFGINRVYWMYKTNALQVKNAINITLNSDWTFGSTKLQYAMLQNVVGQENEFKHSLQLTNKQRYGVHHIELLQSALLPDPLQRLYYGNTIAWQITSLEKQGLQAFSYTFSGNSVIKPVVKVGYKHMQNTYFLVEDTWRNDTLSQIQQAYIHASCAFKFGKFHFQPAFTINYVSAQLNILPKYDLRGRFFWKTNLRNKQKYDLIIGTEAYSKSSYSLLRFNLPWGLYSIDNPAALKYNSILQLDAFVGISIDEMRFYFKYENIDNAWNPVVNRIAVNYPVMPRILRIGLTWDFLN